MYFLLVSSSIDLPADTRAVTFYAHSPETRRGIDFFIEKPIPLRGKGSNLAERAISLREGTGERYAASVVHALEEPPKIHLQSMSLSAVDLCLNFSRVPRPSQVVRRYTSSAPVKGAQHRASGKASACKPKPPTQHLQSMSARAVRMHWGF